MTTNKAATANALHTYVNHSAQRGGRFQNWTTHDTELSPPKRRYVKVRHPMPTVGACVCVC